MNQQMNIVISLPLSLLSLSLSLSVSLFSLSLSTYVYIVNRKRNTLGHENKSASLSSDRIISHWSPLRPQGPYCCLFLFWLCALKFGPSLHKAHERDCLWCPSQHATDDSVNKILDRDGRNMLYIALVARQHFSFSSSDPCFCNIPVTELKSTLPYVLLRR